MAFMSRYNLIQLWAGIKWGLGLGLCGLISCQQASSPESSIIRGGERMHFAYVPDTMDAGMSLTLVCQAQGFAVGDSVYLIWSNTLGEVLFPLTLYADSVLVDIPTALLEERGRVQVSLTYQGRCLDEKELYIKAGPPALQMEAFTGPRGLEVDGLYPSMMVVVPKDRYGNPVEPGTPVAFWTKYPRQAQEALTRPVDHLFSYLYIPSRTVAGKIRLGAQAEGTYIREQVVYQIPGWAVPFQLAPVFAKPVSDGQQQYILETNTITDRFGNPIADGTQIEFEVFKEGNKIASYISYTVGGAAYTVMESPLEPVTWRIRARAEGLVYSNWVTQKFEPYIRSAPVEWNPRDTTVQVGPVTGYLNQLSAEETPVYLTVEKGGVILRAVEETEEGFCRFSLSDWQLSPGSYEAEIRVGGIVQQFNIYIEP